MLFKTYIEPPIDNNNYLIIDELSKEAALIDCSHYDENIFKELNENNAKLKYILLTHGHFDHVAGIRQNYNNHTPQFVMHKNDLNWLNNTNKYLSLYGMPDITIPKIDIYINDNDILKLGNSEIKVIHTPGHTQGGVCYLIENNLFSGDTIFKECVGRCDLDGGNFEQIVDSIKSKIYTLPDDTKIYPGHGSQTTVFWEKQNNRFA